MEVYSRNKQGYIQQSYLGIIRVGLVLDVEVRSSITSPRVYFNPYGAGSEIQVDADYYQAIKELLQQQGIKHQPCKALE